MLYRFIYLAVFLCVLHLLAHSGKPAAAASAVSAGQPGDSESTVSAAFAPVYVLGPGPLQFAH